MLKLFIFRIFDTFDVDPEIIRTAVRKPQADTYFNRSYSKIRDLFLLGTRHDMSILELNEKNRPVEKIRQFFNMPQPTTPSGDDKKQWFRLSN